MQIKPLILSGFYSIWKVIKLKKSEMIKDKDYFTQIIRNGKFSKDRNFVVYFVENESDKSMFGIAIKKSIGSAVTRNKLKRQTRSIIDNNRKLFQLSKDYIIMIREGCLEKSYQELDSSIKKIMKGI